MKENARQVTKVKSLAYGLIENNLRFEYLPTNNGGIIQVPCRWGEAAITVDRTGFIATHLFDEITREVTDTTGFDALTFYDAVENFNGDSYSD